MRTRSRNTSYGSLGLRSGRQLVAVAAKKKRPLALVAVLPKIVNVVTVIPFMRIDSGLPISSDTGAWALSNEEFVDDTLLVRTFYGSRWRTPPFNSTTGAMVKFAFGDTSCIAHVTDMKMKIKDLMKAFKIGARNDFINVERYNYLARASLRIDCESELGQYATEGEKDFNKVVFLRMI
jgi:hypothetical protein